MTGIARNCLARVLRAPVAAQTVAAIALPKPPMWARIPLPTGSIVARRLPFFTTCQPTTSEVQWSMAAKNQHQLSAFVPNRDASVPQFVRHRAAGAALRSQCYSILNFTRSSLLISISPRHKAVR